MFVQEMKDIIKYAIELDIDYLESFLGYDGDKVLKIITKHKEVVDLLEAYIKNLDLEYKSEYELKGKHGARYNLFVGVEDPSVYHLKRDKHV